MIFFIVLLAIGCLFTTICILCLFLKNNGYDVSAAVFVPSFMLAFILCIGGCICIGGHIEAKAEVEIFNKLYNTDYTTDQMFYKKEMIYKSLETKE